MYELDIDFFLEQSEAKPTKTPEPLISVYIEGNRILPPDTPFPGYWSNDMNPFLIELMDNMSPYSPIQEQALMKGAQLGATAIAENIIGYWMDESPAPIMIVSATDDLLDDWTSKRLEPLIDSLGIRAKMTTQVVNKKSRKSGDKARSKEFFGGFLICASAQSPGKQRSNSIRVLIRDEIDGAPAQLRTGEGNYLETTYARTFAWDNRKKIFDLSTPTTIEMSMIARRHELGDQRVFRIPCPYCGKDQHLQLGNDQTTYGLKGDFKAGELVRAYYQCENCREAIFNNQKAEMFAAGRWEPTAKSTSRFFRSYHLPSFYSPVGMLSWTKMYEKYLEALEDPEAMRGFANLYLGIPFKEPGSRPKLAKVIELIGGYKSGTIPEGVLYLVASIDVQRGSEKDERNPARLEMEVMGIGAGYRTWSIMYKVFIGPVNDPFEGAWEDLNDFAAEGGLAFKRRDGSEYTPRMMLVDSGDGTLTEVICRFCERWRNTYPSKGFQELKTRKGEKGGLYDEKARRDFIRYRLADLKFGKTYEISTNYYKANIYNFLNIQRQPTDPQRSGFCDFPRDYNEKYFKMLTAEEKLKDGSFHTPSGARNEALDCRVMNMCASDIYLDLMVAANKEKAKAAGWSKIEIDKITRRVVVDKLEYANRMRV